MSLQMMLVEFTRVDDPICEGTARLNGVVLRLEIRAYKTPAHWHHRRNRLTSVLGLEPNGRRNLVVRLPTQVVQTRVAVFCHESDLHRPLPGKRKGL